MSNEQHLEEILIEAFNLKIYNQVIELSKKYDNLSLSEAILKAFYELTSKIEVSE
jgi:hypothetical protein